METVVIKTRSKADVRFLLDFSKRIGTLAKTINTDEIGDAYLTSLIERGLKTESRSRATPADLSFGAWADMEKSDEEVCADIRRSRHFGKREFAL